MSNDRCVCPHPSTCVYCSRMYPCRCEHCPYLNPRVSDEALASIAQALARDTRMMVGVGMTRKEGRAITAELIEYRARSAAQAVGNLLGLEDLRRMVTEVAKMRAVVEAATAYVAAPNHAKAYDAYVRLCAAVKAYDGTEPG